MSPQKRVSKNPKAESESQTPSSEPPFTSLIVQDLKDAAAKALKNSYSPYSHFAVGAAVLSADGRIFAGTNLENASYGLSICAERSAVAAAVSEGQHRIRTVAIYTTTEEPSPPCGACLSVIAEFADPDFNNGNIPILLSGKIKERWSTLDQLLPERFDLKRFKPKPKER